ncbi:MAG: YfiR family protein [Pseudomonadota bacterium]
MGALIRIVPVLLLAVAVSWPARAQQAVSEYAVKSALLFKLPQFVYRPGGEDDPTIEICLLGRNPFGGAFERLAQMPINGRPVQLFSLGSAAEAGRCDFVFVARSEADELNGVLRRLAAHPVVTVSDIPGFARAGGMVEFALGGEGAAIAILLNRRAANTWRIAFNAQLLRLARVVEP